MKKILVVTVCATLALFASCSKKATSSSSVSTPGSPSASAQPVEIRVEVFNRGTDGGRSDPTNNNYTAWIQEKLLKDENIKVTFVSVPRSDEIPSLNNLMAAGDAPDIVFTYTQSVVDGYRDMGGLFNIAPYIDSELSDLDKFLGEDPGLPGRRFIRRFEDPDTGEIFSLPARRTVTARINTFIRKDWLDKLNLPLPTSTDEFYQALTAFKSQDPGGVGRDSVIPFDMGGRPDWAIGNLLDSFIDPNISIRDWWINTVIDRPYLLPGYKDGVRFANKMFNEGLISKDFPLGNGDDTMNSNLKAGLSGSFMHNYDNPYRDSPGILADLQKNVPGASLVTIDPFKPYGENTKKYLYDPSGLIYFVPASSKNPVAALRYLSWLSRNENSQFLQLGPEGIGWDMVDGLPKVKAAPGLWIQNSPQNIDYTLHINGLDLGNEERTLEVLANSYNHPSELIIDAFYLGMKDARSLPVIPVTLTAAGPYTQTLASLGDQWMTEAIMCLPGQFDAIWENGRKNWLDAGAQAIIDERIEKYQEPQ